MQPEEGGDAVDADGIAVALPLDPSESYPFDMLQSPSPSDSQPPWRSNSDASDSQKDNDNTDWAMPKQSPESTHQIHLPFSSCFRQDSKLFSFPSISIPLALDGDPFAPTSDSTASASELTPPFASLSTSPSPSAHSFSATTIIIPANITTPPTICVDTHFISPELSPSLVHIDHVDGLFLDPNAATAAAASANKSIHQARKSSLIPTYPFSDSMSCISSEQEDDSDEDEVLFLDQTMRDVTDMDPAADEDVTMDDSMCSDFGESLQATFGVTPASAEYNAVFLDEPVSNVFESNDTLRNLENDMGSANPNQSNHLNYPEMFAMEDVANESSGSSSSSSSYSDSDAYESDSERKKRSASKLSKLQKRALLLASASASGDALFSTKNNSQSKKIKLVLRRDAAKRDLDALSESMSDSIRQSGVDMCRATPLSASAPGMRTRGNLTGASVDAAPANEPKPEKVMKKRGRRPGTTVVDGRVVLKSELHLMELGDLLLPPSSPPLPPPPPMVPKSRIGSRRSSFKSTRKGSLKSSLPQLLETLHNSDLKSLVAPDAQSLTVGPSIAGSLPTSIDQALSDARMKAEENSATIDDNAASGEFVPIDMSDDISTSSMFDETETQTNDSTQFEVDAKLISGDQAVNHSQSIHATGVAAAQLVGSQSSEETATSDAAILASATIHSATTFNPLRRSRSLKVGASKQKCTRKDSVVSANKLRRMGGGATSEGVAISAESVYMLEPSSPPAAGTLSTRAHSSSSSTCAPTAAPGNNISPQISLALYSKVQVWEFHISGIGVMRRVSDGWFNCTHILRLAGFGEKSKRTKILERIVETGMAEKIQGGVGKYQGTWIPFERALKMAQEYGVAEKLAPLFEIPV
ncbi:transcriptional regulator swi6 [Chytriomyces hyalinus]|nr:transcriptional regulator swi6 [Chytriomyces hyalinus]